MYSLLVLITSFVSIAASVPTQTIDSRGMYDWSPILADFYSLVDRHIVDARKQPSFPNPPACDLSKASMPVAPTPLPSPDAGTQLLHVAIGRGTQNYTCANASASTTPVSIGALASLYNVSCVAANYPDILAMLPSLALQYPLPADPKSALMPSNIDLSGHHFFETTTIPIFNLDTTPAQQFGFMVAKKIAGSAAPSGTPLGGNGQGSVAWLYLKAEDGSTNNLNSAYRLNTAGGSPPKTCESMPATFTVQYAAEYWFWQS